jgi:hypothetical protein
MTALSQAIDRVCKPVEPPVAIQPGDKYPTHAGVLTLAGYELRCYVLNTGERIFHADDIEKLLGDPSGAAKLLEDAP